MTDWLHGTHALLLAYSATQAPMFAGLLRARAQFHQYALSPLVAAPLMLLAGLGAAASESVITHSGLLTGLGLSVALGYAGGQSLARRKSDAKVHQRGSVVAEAAPPVKSRAKSADPDGSITLAGVPVPALDEAKHFKLIGTTGTGKSTAIREILGQALARGDRAVIADPDGGYMERFYRRDRGDVVLNPFDSRSVKWDLFAEIKNDYDVEQLARSLIPDRDGQDRSWKAYARTFFTAVTRQAREAGIKDAQELYRLLVVADSSELRALVRGTPAQPFLDEHNSRMFDSIRSVTSSAVGALEHISRQTSPSFSVRDWIDKESPGVLFMPYKAGQIAALHSTISAWMRLAIFETMDREVGTDREARADREAGSKNAGASTWLWFVIDELDALGQIDGLKDALARLRKFGASCILGFQSIAQVSNTYGHGEAHTIVENCGNTLILRCSASEGGGTARFASQLIGEREVLRTTLSKSRRVTELWGSVTHSQQLAVESAVLPSQIEQLPDLSGYLKFASDPKWLSVRLDAKRAWEQHRSNPRTVDDAVPRRQPDKSAGTDRE
jgi:Type IV secretion-system coupling protein DNA-binding domain